jgi:hypothetical protein
MQEEQPYLHQEFENKKIAYESQYKLAKYLNQIADRAPDHEAVVAKRDASHAKLRAEEMERDLEKQTAKAVNFYKKKAYHQAGIKRFS